MLLHSQARHSPNSPAFPGQEKFPFITMATDKKSSLLFLLLIFPIKGFFFANMMSENKINHMQFINALLFYLNLTYLWIISTYCSTLVYRIDVQAEINVQVEKFLKNNKRVGLNRRAGGKFSGKSINVQGGNFCFFAFICSRLPHLP